VTFWYGDAIVRLDTHALAHEGRVDAAGRFALQDLLVVTAFGSAKQRRAGLLEAERVRERTQPEGAEMRPQRQVTECQIDHVCDARHALRLLLSGTPLGGGEWNQAPCAGSRVGFRHAALRFQSVALSPPRPLRRPWAMSTSACAQNGAGRGEGG